MHEKQFILNKICSLAEAGRADELRQLLVQ